MTEENSEIVKDSPFISDDDTFEIKVNYYKDGKKIIVEGSDGFDENKEKSTIVFVIRYPSQADCENIILRAKRLVDPEKEELDAQNILRMEAVRFLILVKSWNMKEELNNTSIMNLSPDIVRQVIMKIRNEVGVNGLF